MLEPCAVLVALLASCASSAPLGTVPPQVEIAPAGERSVSVTLPFTGRVEPARSLPFVAREDARVVQVAAADGAAVAGGALVFSLGGPRATARGEALQTMLEAARSGLQAAEAQLQRARRRAEVRIADPGEIAAATEVRAAAAEEAARAQAALSRHQDALRLRAPWAGVFTQRRVSEGQEVLEGATLGTLVDPASSRVRAAVLPDAGHQPAAGQRAWLEGASGESLQVRAVLATADAGGRTQLWIEGPSLSSLALGTPVRGRVEVAVHATAITVPPDAVVRDRDDHPLVYVGSAFPYEARPVTLGVAGPDQVEITSGLEPGEDIVVKGAYELYWASFAHELQEPD